MSPRKTGWEPAVFRWSGRLALTITAVAGAVALVWGEDLHGTRLAWTVLALAVGAALVASAAFAAAYHRQRTLMREAAKRRHPSARAPYNQMEETR